MNVYDLINDLEHVHKQTKLDSKQVINFSTSSSNKEIDYKVFKTHYQAWWELNISKQCSKGSNSCQPTFLTFTILCWSCEWCYNSQPSTYPNEYNIVNLQTTRKNTYLKHQIQSTKKIWNVGNDAKIGKFCNSGRNIVIKWEVWLVEYIDQIHDSSLVSKDKCLKFQLK